MTESKKNPLGPTGERVQANLARIRDARGLTYRELSDRLEALGRGIPVLGLSRIERGERRVDADDLVALALALGVSPATLLLPHEPTDGIALTPTTSVSWKLAWRWANGELPIVRHESGSIVMNAPAIAEFIRECRPYEASNPMDEARRFMIMRFPPGINVRISVSGKPESDDAS